MQITYSIEVFGNEILTAWQPARLAKEPQWEVIIISESINSEIIIISLLYK